MMNTILRVKRRAYNEPHALGQGRSLDYDSISRGKSMLAKLPVLPGKASSVGQPL